jgi:hypoxanthine-DNA glycosylase
VKIRGFAPLCGGNATRLILGSMPGNASLAAAEYYAHPRNAFWSIVEALLGAPRAAPYPDRVLALTDAGIALWDVLESCRRLGSLDSAIQAQGMVVNDLRRFLAKNPGISHIYFNGGTARVLFERHVAPTLPGNRQAIARTTLPSTSPANARMPLAGKIRAWRVITRSH